MPTEQATGVYNIGQPQLLDTTLPLEVRVLDDLQYHRVLYREEPVIHRVVDYLAFGYFPEGSFSILILGNMPPVQSM